MSVRTVILTIVFLLMCGGTAFPQKEMRPISQIYSFTAGCEKAYDSYLSPLSYSGFSMSVNGSWLKGMAANPEHLVMRIDASLATAFMGRWGSVTSMYDFNLLFGWSVQWRHSLPCGLQLSAGAGPEMELGALYMPFNGNNPATARFYIGLALKAGGAYPVRLGKIHALITDDVSLPSAGAFFSQQYGESYYEISLGNRTGLAHFGWWGNRFCITNLLALNMQLSKAALRIGYRLSVGSSWVNNLNTRRTTHALEIGIIPGGVGVGKNKKEIPNAIYY